MAAKTTGKRERNQALVAALSLLGASLGIATQAGAEPIRIKDQAPTTGTQIKGETTSRQIKGETTSRQIKGETTSRQIKGETTSRQIKGETTSKQIKGETTGTH